MAKKSERKAQSRLLRLQNLDSPSLHNLGTDILIGPQKTIVKIWSANAINRINKDTTYHQLQEILTETGFSDIAPHNFLLYNKEGRDYQTSTWTSDERSWNGLFTDRQESLKDLERIAKEFLGHHSSENNILTYPAAYDNVVKICKRILVSHPHPRYAKPGQKPKSYCRIEKIPRN